MSNKIFIFREKLNDFWFIPVTSILLAMLLSALLINLDKTHLPLADTYSSWLFSGTPSAARSLLGTIAGAAITVIAIAFSITVVAVQQVAAQYSSRIIRSFTSDRGNQLVLGIYVATFVFSLLTLRAVRDRTETIDEFVPVFATTGALVLSLISIISLVYFIHHITTTLQATTIAHGIYEQLMAKITGLVKKENELDNINNKVWRPIKNKNAKTVSSNDTGFITEISIDTFKNKMDSGSRLEILCQIGKFVQKDEQVAIFTLNSDNQEAIENTEKMVHKSIVIKPIRSELEDVLYLLQQLVDVALKALSPGINDPTSAEYCLNYIGAAVSELSNRSKTTHVHYFENGSMVKTNVFSWPELIERAYFQLVHYSQNSPRVQSVLYSQLKHLEEVVDKPKKKPVKKMIKTLESNLKNSEYPKFFIEDIVKV